MSRQAQVEQLLEEMLSGRTLDEVAADAPELVEEVRERWNHVRRVQAQLEALFPRSEEVPSAAPPRAQPSAPLADIPGYDVTDVLGRGGMGIVYRGTHRKLQRAVAIKMLLANRYATPLEAVSLSREAQAIAALRHCNIVQVYDVGEVDGCPYFTMEYVDGGTLSEKIAGAPMPVPEATKMIVTLARAVEVAHHSGIVHRDLKPANVLLAADGTPKVSDFGLAHRCDTDNTFSLMQTGARIGTPSYMAPEQALGQRDRVGPSADVYALGAILYEMLTGRPPFVGDSVAETERQLLTQEPVAPSRLNGRVPRDLETICLKCLQKSPAKRYETAGMLADDVQRFQRDEPILARRAGAGERSIKWARRHPTTTTALAAGTVLLAAGFSAVSWLLSSRASAGRAADADLRDAVHCLQRSDWPAASRAIDRAGLRVGDGGPSDLLDRLAKARADLALAAKLDKIRLDGAISINGELELHRSSTGDAYSAAFADAGLARTNEDPAVVARRLRESSISDALLAALDSWTFAGMSSASDPWLMSVVERAHAKPDGSSDDLLPLVLRGDPAQFIAYVEQKPISRRSLPLLLATASKLAINGHDPVPMLRKLQAAFPDDFWANELLGSALDGMGSHEESLRFLQAAMAIRPDVALSYNNLGRALFNMQKFEEALAQFRRAVAFDPDAASTRSNLASALVAIGDLKAAEEQALLAVNAKGLEQAGCFHTLAAVYLIQGRMDEAISASRRAVAIEPTNTLIQEGLRTLLRRAGRQDEAIAAWRAAIEANPTSHPARDGLAEHYLYLGRIQAYEQARVELLEKFGDSDDPPVCERTGRACLLLPSSVTQLRRATAAIDRAVGAAESSPRFAGSLLYYKFAKSLACYRADDFESALKLATESAGVLKPAPQLVAAMAEFRLGRQAEARAHLADAIASGDWGDLAANGPDAREVWIYHILRREAERLVTPAH